MLIEIKKQNTILADMAVALEASGVLPSPNALSAADQNAADPLVQIYTGFSSALSELYLSVEGLQNQLDYRTANANWLAALHGSRFGVDLSGMGENEARAVIAQLDADGVRNGDPATVVMGAAGVSYAKAVYGQETMLVVKNKQGQTIPDGAIAEALYNGVPSGFYTFVGDKLDSYGAGGMCYEYRYQPAERVIIGIEVRGSVADCEQSQWAAAANQLIQTFNCENQLNFGGTVSSAEILQSISRVAGLKLNSVKIVKRGAKFVPLNCPPEYVDFYDCDGVLETVDFTNENAEDCQFSAGYVWCDDYGDCVSLKPWEYPDLHPNFITFIEEAAQC